jgi:hypothetical protein
MKPKKLGTVHSFPDIPVSAFMRNPEKAEMSELSPVFSGR